MTNAPIPSEIDALAREIVDAGIKVHRTLGPGLLESVYELCLVHELTKRGLKPQRQVSLPVVYDDVKLDGGLRIDLLVNGLIVVEVKAVEGLLPVHQSQILTYLKLSGCRLGFLMNFNVPLLKDGLRRFAV
ncbi:MAG: GxxExxY protein [Micropepsaceae bacterium]